MSSGGFLVNVEHALTHLLIGVSLWTFLFCSLSAAGLEANWFTVEGMPTPAIGELLQDKCIVLSLSLSLAAGLAAHRMLVARWDRRPGRPQEPSRLFLLIAGSFAALPHAHLWIARGWLAPWHDWPTVVIVLMLLFPAAVAVGLMLGLAGRITRHRAVAVAAILVPVIAIFVPRLLAMWTFHPAHPIHNWPPVWAMLAGAFILAVLAGLQVALAKLSGRPVTEGLAVVFWGLWALAAVQHTALGMSAAAGNAAPGAHRWLICISVAVAVALCLAADILLLRRRLTNCS